MLSERTTAVHATHLSDNDIRLLARHRTTVCLCPTTERDLADGIGPARALADAGCGLSLGSDQNAVIDPFEEARGLESHERLATQRRGRFSQSELLGAAANHASLGWSHSGELAVGGPTWSPYVRTRPAPRGSSRSPVLMAATAADVDTVVVDGSRSSPPAGTGSVTWPGCWTTRSGRCGMPSAGHGEAGRADRRPACRQRPRPRVSWCRHPELPRARGAVRRRAGMSSALVTGIGQLVTCDESRDGAGHDGAALGIVDDAAVVVEDGTVAWVGPQTDAPAADRAVDIDGRCVIPGFVDSHTHLVFAGERSAEFAARMTGTPYDGGGIASTVRATRTASDGDLRALLAARVAEARALGTTTLEVKSGYGLTVEAEQRSLRLAGEVTAETTFLGAHVVPPEYARRRADYVHLVTGPMLEACAPYARWVDVFCEPNSPHAFDEDEAREVLLAGRRAGLLARVHGDSSAPDPASGWPSTARPAWTTARSCPAPTLRPSSERPPRPSRRCCPVSSSRPARRTRTPAGCWLPVCRSRWRATATPERATPRRCRSLSPWPSGRWA